MKTDMKQGWEIKKLGEVCKVIAGQSPEGKFYNDNRNGLPFYQGKKEYGEKYIGVPTTWTTKVTKEAEANDILMSVRAPVGPINFATQKICIGRGLAAIRATKLIDKEFLYSFLLKHESEIVGNTGAVFNSINKSQIEAIEIPLPPLPEQQRIVSILDQAFAAIATAKANAEQNLNNAKELFESYLQLIIENGKLKIESGDWEEKMIMDIGITQTGTTPKTADKANYGDFIPFIKPADIDITGNGEIRYDNDGISEQGLRNGRKMLSGSILMVCIGATIGKVGFVDRDVSCNQQINTLTVKKEFFPKFFYYALSTKGFFEQVMQNAAQATLPIINKGKWEKLTVSYPKSISEQQSIVANLDALSAETKRLEAIYRQKVLDLEELKKSVLQKAFAGQLKIES
jgi:type I restriction enzyme S subunit